MRFKKLEIAACADNKISFVIVVFVLFGKVELVEKIVLFILIGLSSIC